MQRHKLLINSAEGGYNITMVEDDDGPWIVAGIALERAATLDKIIADRDDQIKVLKEAIGKKDNHTIKMGQQRDNLRKTIGELEQNITGIHIQSEQLRKDVIKLKELVTGARLLRDRQHEHTIAEVKRQCEQLCDYLGEVNQQRAGGYLVPEEKLTNSDHG